MTHQYNRRATDQPPKTGLARWVEKSGPYVWALALASFVTTLTQLVGKQEVTQVLLIVCVAAIIVMLWVRMTACEIKHEACERRHRLEAEKHNLELRRRDIVIWRLYDALVQINSKHRQHVDLPDISDILPKPGTDPGV